MEIVFCFPFGGVDPPFWIIYGWLSYATGDLDKMLPAKKEYSPLHHSNREARQSKPALCNRTVHGKWVLALKQVTRPLKVYSLLYYYIIIFPSRNLTQDTASTAYICGVHLKGHFH